MNINLLEWLGYLASLVVLVSLLMSSIIKLRWINLFGSLLFSAYGFLIGALPVGLMNLGISLINIYYLIKMYKSKEFLKILPIENESTYLQYFLDFYKNDIRKYSSQYNPVLDDEGLSLYILRDVVPAGVFIGAKYDDNTIKVELDYAIPKYRDFKLGEYLYNSGKDKFLEKGFNRLICFSNNEAHNKYLIKMGFVESTENGKVFFEKFL